MLLLVVTPVLRIAKTKQNKTPYCLEGNICIAYGDYRESNNFGESGDEVPWGRSDISVLFEEKSVE